MDSGPLSKDYDDNYKLNNEEGKLFIKLLYK